MNKLSKIFLFFIVICFITISSTKTSKAQYYWVGNGGDWTDLSHWATTSGGAVFHVQLPQASDIVYFDNLSFDTDDEIVLIDTSYIECQTINWIGVSNDPSFVGTSYDDTLIITGNLILVDSMIFDFVGNLFFTNIAPTIQDLQLGGNTIKNNCYINTGSLRLLDEFTQSNGIVKHTNGIIDLNGNNFHCINYNLDTTSAITVVSPEITGNDSIFIGGCFYLDPAHDISSFTGPIYITNNKTDTIEIDFAGNALTDEIYINYGNYNLLSDITTNGNIDMSEEIYFDANAHNISCNSFTSFTTLTQEMNFDNSQFNISGGGEAFIIKSRDINNNAFSNANITFLSAGTDTVRIYAERSGNPLPIGVIHLNSVYHEFMGDMLIDSLYVLNGRKLMLFQGIIVELNELNATGNCGSYIYINASCDVCSAAIPIIKTNSGPENIDYIILKNIEGQGGFNATNSYEEGDVTGFTVTNLASSSTFYWVGNQGIWHNPTNWSTTSGGASGTCIPAHGDDVVFDANSFSANDTVFIPENAYCNKMTWVNLGTNPVLTSNNQTLSIYDTLTLHANLTLDINGLFYLKNELNDTSAIYSNGVSFSDDIEIDALGLWKIEDDLIVDGDITFTEGLFTISNMHVECDHFISYEETTKKLEMSSSSIYLNGSNVVWNLDSTTFLTIINGNSTIKTNTTSTANCYFNGENFNYDTLLIANTSTQINGSNSFNLLEITPGSSIVLEALSTQTVDSIIATGSCSSPIQILCSDAGIDTATIIKSGYDTLYIDNVILNNIVVDTTGGKEYNSSNATLLNNCNRWTELSTGSGMDYYWIAGSGDWNDVAHWSNTSGGASFGCIPGIKDTVIFDANSLAAPSTLNINTKAWCYSLDMTAIDDSLEVDLQQNIHCVQAFSINDSVKIKDDTHQQSIVFIPNTNTAILTTESSLIQANILLVASNDADSLIINDSLSIYYLNSITVQRGVFYSNNQNISTGSIFLSTDNTKDVNLGSSDIDIMYNFEILDNSNLSLNAGTSFINVIGHSKIMTTIFDGSGETFYNISFETPLDTLDYAEDENFVKGNNFYHNMYVLPGTHMYYENGMTQTIDTLFALGNCTDSIYFYSDSDGDAASITQTTGDSLYAEVLVMKDITAISNGKALFSRDDGNNTNWNFYSGNVTTADFTWLIPSCVNDSSTFLNNSSVYNGDIANLSYKWYFGDGDTSILENPKHIYDYSGDYDVSLVSTYINGCKDSITKTITLYKPIISLSSTNASLEICDGETVTFSAISNINSQNYEFYVNNIHVSSIVDSTYTTDTIHNGDEFFATAELNGCLKYSDTLTFTVNPRPITNLSCDDIDQVICDGDTVNFIAIGADEYQFSLNGSTLGSYDTTSTLTLSNLYDNDTITVSGIDTTTGCDYFSIDTLIFTVHPLPSVMITSVLPNDTICFGDTATISANGALLYEFFVNSNSQGIPALSNTFESAAFNNHDIVSVQGTSVFGCKSYAPNPVEIIVNPTPVMTFTTSDSNSEICLGDNVDFIAGGASEYEFFVSGISMQGPGFSNSYATTTLANADYIQLIGSIGNCYAEADTVFTFIVHPSITLVSSETEICEGETVTFTANGDVVYQFLVNGTNATTLGATNTYVTDTLHPGDIVSVVGTLGSCTPLPIAVNVHPSPTITMTCSDIDTIICVGETVFFTASGATTYEFFVNGNSVAPASSLNIYSTDSINDGDIISVSATSIYGCFNTSLDVFTFEVFPYPVVSMTESDGDLQICEGESVTFTASGADNYEFFINGVSQGAASPTNVFTTTALSHLNTVTVEGTSNTCSFISDSTFTYTVYSLPYVQLTPISSLTLCEGDTLFLLATGANNYEFFVNGLSQGPPSGNGLFSSTTITNGQIVSVVGSSNSCVGSTDTAYTITINAYPIMAMTCSDPNSEICYGELVNFTASGASQYQYYIDGIAYGTIDTTSTYQSSILEDGQTITSIGYNGSCAATSDTTFTISVHKMQLSLSNNSQGNMICENDTITFTATGADSYEFFIDNVSQGASSATNTFSTSTLFHGQIVSVQGTSTSTTCVQNAYDIIWITVFGTPIITSLDPTQFCEGDSARLMSNYIIGNQWYLDGDSIIAANQQQYVAYEEGLYKTSVHFGGDAEILSIGYNGSGQLGDGTNFNSLTTVSPLNVNDINDISCGDDYSLALLSDGSVWSWGENSFGELGNGSYADNPTPYQITSLTNIEKVSAGGNHNLAILADSSLVAWGMNLEGQLGYGNNATSNFPFPVLNLTNVVDIACGGNHSIALLSDSTVWAWGANNYGQLGDGTNSDKNIPTQVLNLNNIVSVYAGANHSLAIDANGKLWTWGCNIAGQLGDNSIVSKDQAVMLNTISSIYFVDVDGGIEHTIALDTNGFAYSWGTNTHGQLSQDGAQYTTPMIIDSISNIANVEAGYYASYFLRQDKTVWACGHNNQGQLGDSTQIDAAYPINTENIAAANNISAGKAHVAVLLGGKLSCMSSPISITVDTIPDIIIYQNGLQLSTIGGGVSYQWYLNGNPIPGATGQNYNITANGAYTVEIIFGNGCSGISDPFNYNVGMDEFWNDNNISLYPNPNNGGFNLVFNLPLYMLSEINEISCYNVLGEIVYIDNSPQLHNEISISIAGSPKGVYYVCIHTATKVITKKFIII